MNRTKIEYLDYTWNPIVGCSGLGCAVRMKCWAARQAKRKKRECSACYSFVPHVHWERLEQPLAVKKPSRIGVCFMGEFYDQEIPENVRASIAMRMEKASQHTYVIFTKQPQNIDDWVPKNTWICVSVNRLSDVWRIRALINNVPKDTIKGVSFEPLYEDLSGVNLKGIDWIVIGAQTRPTLFPKYDWVLGLMQKQIPVFLKNNLIPIMGTNNLCKKFPKEKLLGAST